MRVRATGRYAVGLSVVALAVAGCTTSTPDPGVIPIPSTTHMSAPSTTPASSSATQPTSSSATTTSVPGDLSIGGAQEFVSTYIAKLNEALRTAKPELISGLTAGSCKTCAIWLSRTEALEKDGRHLTADLLTANSITASTLKENTAEVLVIGEQKGADVVNSDGAKVDTVPKIAKANFIFTLTYDKGWKVGLWQSEE